MGVFDWIKNSLFHPYDDLLPKPTWPAPPMSECKPPKQEEPKEELKVLNISEPTIKLLEMLKRNEWEVAEVMKHDFRSSIQFMLTHVYKEALTLSVTHLPLYDMDGIDYLGSGFNWATEDECKVLFESLVECKNRNATLARQHKQELWNYRKSKGRAKYQQFINAL